MWNSSAIDLSTMVCSTPFTRRDLERLGISEYALWRKERYRTIFRGVWVDDDTTSKMLVPFWADQHWLWLWQKVFGLQLVRQGAVASHETAAVLYGLPIPQRMKKRTAHVTTLDTRPRVGGAGVKRHIDRWMLVEPSTLFDVVVVKAWQIFFQLAPELTVEELVKLGDALVGRQAGGPYTTVDVLRSAVATRKRLPARAKVTTALKMIRETVESPQETWLRLWLVDHGFPEPEVHPEIRISTLGRPLHPDLGYLDLKVAIEYEGDHHRTSSKQFARDLERIQLLEAEGWIVLRVSKDTDMTTFAGILRDVLSSR